MARGDGYDGALPGAMQRLAGPAVGYREVFIHAIRLVARFGRSKRRGRPPLPRFMRKVFGTKELVGDFGL